MIDLTAEVLYKMPPPNDHMATESPIEAHDAWVKYAKGLADKLAEAEKKAEEIQAKLDCGDASCGACAMCERLARMELHHAAERRAEEASNRAMMANGLKVDLDKARDERDSALERLYEQGERADHLADALRERVVEADPERKGGMWCLLCYGSWLEGHEQHHEDTCLLSSDAPESKRAVAPLGPLEKLIDDGQTYVVPSGSGPVSQFDERVQALIRQWWDEHQRADQLAAHFHTRCPVCQPKGTPQLRRVEAERNLLSETIAASLRVECSDECKALGKHSNG